MDLSISSSVYCLCIYYSMIYIYDNNKVSSPPLETPSVFIGYEREIYMGYERYVELI